MIKYLLRLLKHFYRKLIEYTILYNDYTILYNDYNILYYIILYRVNKKVHQINSKIKLTFR